MAAPSVADASKAMRDLMKRMIDHHAPANYVGTVVTAQPIEVAISGMDMTLSEDETLLISHAVRKYDQEHTLAEGDSLLLVPVASGEWVATSVLTENANLGGVVPNKPDGSANVAATTELTGTLSGATVTVAGTPYPVVGGTVHVPVVGTTPFVGAEGDELGQIPLV